jgi:GNAT superfamily N-acetyltransferase
MADDGRNRVKTIILEPDAVESRLGDLAAILVDAVAGGASVSFMSPFGREQALEYWGRVGRRVSSGEILLFVALVEGKAVGTVQLVPAAPPNQAHRAEVAKLLVLSDYQNRGVGRALMAHLESEALSRGRTLLTLDTLTGTAAEKLYLSLGYTFAGAIPEYARLPGGPLAETSIFYKKLGKPTT